MFVVITGASRGIGKSLAYIFASHKYNLILTCEKNIELLNSIKIDLEKKYKIKVIVIKGNIYDIKNNIDLKNVRSKVYMVINNQSKADYHILQDISEEIFDDVINSNVKNALFTTKFFVDDMIKNNQGIIVNISSIWGEFGASCEILYSMTKGAINTFTKSLSKELSETNIDVIGFMLGMVDTDMNNHLTNEEKDMILQHLIDKKMMTSSDVAKMIYDIISNKQYKSGYIFDLDNGIKNL